MFNYPKKFMQTKYKIKLETKNSAKAFSVE
jgi:hypothetical protein